MRANGILLHISSLPSPYGIGTMGRCAYEFVDFLAAGGQTYWQILPACPTTYGDSPYQSFSVYAGNPYFIDLDMLAEEGLLQLQEYQQIEWSREADRVDYGILYEKRFDVLRLAVNRFLENPAEDYESFCEENRSWLLDYALFMTLKMSHQGAPWWAWEADAAECAEQEMGDEVTYWKVLQYLFFSQWKKLKKYANDKGVSIIGDLPIYVSQDSVDVWRHPELFLLDENQNPIAVAGYPPDCFTESGQLWGNPLYRWEDMAKDGYKWWVDRICYFCEMYDVLRLDHFLGYDSYYAVPYGDKDAKRGKWCKGPGMELFARVRERVNSRKIIAEDLGCLTDSVQKLLDECDYPGMKILQNAFDSTGGWGQEYLPHNYPVRCVAYPGTHDNQTIMDWLATRSAGDEEYARKYMRIHKDDEFNWGMMMALWASPAELTIVQMQDVLGLGAEARMNLPATTGSNWSWRCHEGDFSPELAKRLFDCMRLYERCSVKDSVQ